MLSKFNWSAISVNVLFVFIILFFANSVFFWLIYELIVEPVRFLNSLHRVERLVLKIKDSSSIVIFSK